MSGSGGRRLARTALATAVVATGLTMAPSAGAAAAEGLGTFQRDLVGPAGSDRFGNVVLVLSNGNYVVTDPRFDAEGTSDVGAVYLYDGTDHTVISTLTGSTVDDEVGSGGVIQVGSSDFVVSSPAWNSPSAADVGAVTWVNGATGRAGTVSRSNSLHGTEKGDAVGSAGVEALTNGNYVVSSPRWDGSKADAGAVTWASGASGSTGPVAKANSLYGTTKADRVGSAGITALANGNYVVRSPEWDLDDEDVSDAGAVTWAKGTGTTTGAVSAKNSMYGVEDDDSVGVEVVALTQGNYVVVAPRQGSPDRFTATWASGSGVTSSPILNPKMVRGRSGDALGTVTPLTNGNYVVSTPTAASRGFITWVDGSDADDRTFVRGGPNDYIGSGGVLALTNGNFVVLSPNWLNDDDDDAEVGAATWGDGSTGLTAIDEANSFIGDDDGPVARNGVALRNGNYVISSPAWGDGGAVTWASGRLGRTGTISTANSLYGNADRGRLGGSSAEPGVVALADGDYVITAPEWDNGATDNVGLAVWARGTAQTAGLVTATSGLAGTRKNDRVGSSGVVPLQNGPFVVNSPNWDRGAIGNAGAITWSAGTGALPGSISSTNSLVGPAANDLIGIGGVMPLLDQGFAFSSPRFGATDAGAVTRVGKGGATGELTSTNSAFGTSPGSVLLPEQRLAADGSLVMSTEQNRVMLLQPESPPEFGPAPDVTVTAERGATGAEVAFPTPVATDVQSTPTVSCDPASGSTFSIGATKITCTATDSAGLTATTSFSVNVLPADDGPPTISPASDVAVVAERGAGSAVVTFPTPDATDVESTPTVICSPPSGTSFVLGATEVTCTATDSANLTDTTTFNVVVSEFPDGPPTFTQEPPDIDVTTARGQTSVAVSFAVPTATDVESTPTVACDRNSGDLFVIGTSTVSCVATDSAGLQDRVEFVVTVTASLDGPPAFDSAPASITVQAAPGNVVAAVTYPTPTASDAESVPTVQCLPASGTLFVVGATTVECTATDSFGLTAVVTFTVTVLPSDLEAPDIDDVIPVEPARLADTRPGQDTVDGMFRGGGPFGAGNAIEVDVIGRGGVAVTAAAVLVNVTVINPTAKGFATVYACNPFLPYASTLNFDRGRTVANSTLVPLSEAGRLCVYTSSSTNVAVDVIGYVPIGAAMGTLDPARLLDSRAAGVGATIDGQFLGQGLLTAGTPVEVQVAGRGGVPIGSTGALLNLTAINPTGKGFATLYPCTDAPPNASSLNVERGQNIANSTIVQLSSTGTACVVVSIDMHLAIDVVGSVGPRSDLATVEPARLLDSREGPNARTTDGQAQGTGLLAANEVIEVQISGRGGVPDDANGAMLNLTAIAPAGNGFATLFPCTPETPNASSLNFVARTNIANSTFVQLSDTGAVCIFSSAASHVALDVVASVSAQR